MNSFFPTAFFRLNFEKRISKFISNKREWIPVEFWRRIYVGRFHLKQDEKIFLT